MKARIGDVLRLKGQKLPLTVIGEAGRGVECAYVTNDGAVKIDSFPELSLEPNGNQQPSQNSGKAK